MKWRLPSVWTLSGTFFFLAMNAPVRKEEGAGWTTDIIDTRRPNVQCPITGTAGTGTVGALEHGVAYQLARESAASCVCIPANVTYSLGNPSHRRKLGR